MALKAPIHQFTETRTIHISGRDFLYISNLISMFRLLIAPLIFWVIYKGNYELAVVIGGIAIVSDLLDGFFARVLNQHSELGYILDPVADKFAIGAGIFALVLSNTTFPKWAFAAVIFRDVAIVLGNVYLAYKAKMITRSNWWGKCTSFSLSIAVILYLIRAIQPNLFPERIAFFTLCVALVFVVISAVSYARHMFRVLKTEAIQTKVKH
ncbi:MAG: CDP-alcohol phosphatidyltransferase family protein [Candidatus Poribacteria bacterium]|nr:CDP-alcohol phosphatidyltransferase family protein [Candidatus Poribacteria bacterium]